MYIVLFIFSFFSILSEYTEQKIKIFMLFFIYLVTVFILGTRWETGTDWIPYLNFFNSLDNNYFEIGYIYFNKILKLFTNNYSIFLFLQTSIVFFFFTYFSYKTFINCNTSFIVILIFLFPYMGANRQYLAFSLIFFAFHFYEQKKYYFFLLIVFLASLMHQASIFFILLLFIGNLKLRKRYIFFTLILLFLLRIFAGSHIGPAILGLNLPSQIRFRLIQYIQIFPFSPIRFTLGIIRRFIPLLIILFFRDKMMINNERDTFLNLYIISIITYIVPYGYAQILVSRLSLYFEIFGYLQITKYLEYTKGYRKLFFHFLLLFLSLVYLTQAIQTNYPLYFPYKGIFINHDFFRALY